MEVDPTAEELQSTAAKTSTVTANCTNTSANVMTGTTGRRFVLKRRLQNGAASGPANNGGESNNNGNGNQLVPQLISSPALGNNNSASGALVSNRVASVGSGSLKIRKIEP